ncbi:hypothetical protein QTP88_026831 [Uroleucon formosanum]
MRDVEIIFNSLIEELKMEFKTVEYVCLTADCLTVFHNKALACRRIFGRHTYDNIAEILDRIINEFHLQNKMTLIVTDNASNFVKAFKIFNENSEITEILSNEDENEEVVRSVEIVDILDNVIVENLDCLTLPPHQRCAAHTLNLIATVDILAAENEGAYKRISRRVFGKCQSLFNKQNQSSQSADQIEVVLGRYLLTPNATRYASLSEDADSPPKAFIPPPVKLSSQDQLNIPPANIESPSPTKVQTVPFYVSEGYEISTLKNALFYITESSSILFKSTPKYLIIHAGTVIAWNTIFKFLADNEQFKLHTQLLKPLKPYRVFIRHLHPSMPVEDIQAYITDKRYEVIQVTNILHRINKNALPLFRIDLKPTTNNSDILNLDSLLHTKIKIKLSK